jgi:hypothetical protein
MVFEECNRYLMVFDYEDGISLLEYLLTHSITEAIGKKIIGNIL